MPAIIAKRPAVGSVPLLDDCLDLQPHERRLVLLLERDDVDDTEPLAGAEEDLLARLDHHPVGRLARIAAVLEVQPVPEHRSSVSGAGRRADSTR